MKCFIFPDPITCMYMDVKRDQFTPAAHARVG